MNNNVYNDMNLLLINITSNSFKSLYFPKINQNHSNSPKSSLKYNKYTINLFTIDKIINVL